MVNDRILAIYNKEFVSAAIAGHDIWFVWRNSKLITNAIDSVSIFLWEIKTQ